MIKQLCVVALFGAVVSACTPTGKACSTTDDCDSGQVCSGGQCRATNSGTGGGSGGGGGSTGGGGGTIFTGCNPNGGVLNQTKDTDCDGLSDSAEYNVSHTDPCNADSDGDGLLDGLETGSTSSVSATCTFTADAQPTTVTDPKKADTDGDGVNDGQEDTNHNGRVDVGEADPLRQDTDCDGYSDGAELAAVAGCVTNPAVRDTDGDGLPDGVEGGLASGSGADPTGCTYTSVTYDADPATRGNACDQDSDGDGILDGAEDANLNGRVDVGELDPASDAGISETVRQACAAENLRPISFHTNAAADVQIALEPAFAEVTPVVDVNGTRGFAFYDANTHVAGLAISKAPAGGDAAAEEALGRTRVGGVSNPLTQTFTTWDGFPALRAIYDVSGGEDAKAKVNAIVAGYTNVTGALSGTAGVTGPFKVVAEFVRRTANRAVVVIGVVPSALYTGQALFRVDDVAGGTALAQYGDFANTQCEVFNASVNAKVDFIWVVDDSCSMSISQTALSNIGTLFSNKLATAGLDWRAGMCSTSWWATGYTSTEWHRGWDWVLDAATMAGHFTDYGTAGTGAESGFISAQNYVGRVHGNLPTSGLRSDAQAHFIYVTDTWEQSASINPTQQQSWMNGLGVARSVAHGITCPPGQTCGEGEDAELPVSEYATLVSATGGVQADIRTFNDTSAGAAQQATIDAILTAVIGGTGTQLQRPPISPTIKVAVATVRGSNCNKNDVPRDRTNGWDIDAATRRIVFFGDCIPDASGVQVAVSYKYWVDGSTNPEGDPCLGECGNNEFCETTGDVSSCVCKPDCGGCGSGLKCQPTTCSCVPDIG